MVGRIGNKRRSCNNRSDCVIFYCQMGCKSGIKEAYKDITGKKHMEDIKLEKQLGHSDDEELK